MHIVTLCLALLPLALNRRVTHVKVGGISGVGKAALNKHGDFGGNHMQGGKAALNKLGDFGGNHIQGSARKSALGITEAEEVFVAWREELERKASCYECGASPVKQAASAPVANASLLEAFSEVIPARNAPSSRFAKAIADAATQPEHAISACLTLKVDLAGLGFPGVVLTMSFRGEVEYTLCTRCFTWKLEADLSFEYEVLVLGHGLSIGLHAAGSIDLKELPCEDAAESAYCRFLYLFLPPEKSQLSRSLSRCHSDSPMDSLSAFIAYQWRKLKSTVGKEHVSFKGTLADQLDFFAKQMDAYPLIFSADARPRYVAESALNPPRRKILLATCVGALRLNGLENFISMATVRPFCQLEIAPQEASPEENFQRVYGDGPASTRECNELWDSDKSVCQYPDRCTYKASLHKLRRCSYMPSFHGEVWRSSFVGNTFSPVWNESHAFSLPLNTTKLRIRAGVHSYTYNFGPRTIGSMTLHNVTLYEAGQNVVTVSMGKNASLTIALQWLDEPQTGMPLEEDGDTPNLRRVLGAMAAATEGFVGKLPGYANRLQKQLIANHKPEADVKYRKLSGRYLARWRRENAQGHDQEKELEDLGEFPHVHDKNAPTGDKDCKWNANTRTCIPELYCHRDRRVCKLKPIAVSQCTAYLGHLYCCNFTESGQCRHEPTSRTACRDPSMSCIRSLTGVSKCACEPGLCYNEVLGRCVEQKLNCAIGTYEQQQACHHEQMQRELYASKPKQRSANWLLKSFKRFSAPSWAMRKGKPCATTELDGDERVLNFARALKQSRLAKSSAPRKRMSFFSEFVTSLANLFVRSVSDVQAIFNVYFANDPFWDDDCMTLTPSFQLFYEFPSESTMHGSHLQPQSDSGWLTHRMAENSTYAKIGKLVKEKDNPWCQYSWASRAVNQAGRADFVRQNPPRGRAMRMTTRPRRLGSQMMPHVWCVLAQQFRSTWEGKSSPFGGIAFRRGWTVGFQAACSQLRFFSSGDQSGEFKLWRRYDCERAVLGSAFLTMFPSFAEKVKAMQHKLGSILEDVLQCTGNLGRREFPSENDFVATHCQVTADELLRRGEKKDDETERLAFVAAMSNRMMSVLSEWLDILASRESERKLFEDFEALWAHGDRLTGLAFNADTMTKAFQTLGTESAIKQRAERLRHHLLKKAWLQRGQTDKALFPPPVHYEVIVKTGIAASTSSRDVCKAVLEPRVGGELEGLYQRIGMTFLPLANDELRFCMQSTFAPLSMFEVTLIGCYREVGLDGESVPETSWTIGLRSILNVEDQFDKARKKLSAFFEDPLKPFSGSKLKADNIGRSAAWSIAKTILTDPLSSLSDSLGGGKEAMQLVMNKVGEYIREQAFEALKMKAKITEAAKVLKRKLLSHFELLSLKSYRSVEVRMHFTKVGGDSYQPSFTVRYKDAISSAAGVGFPGVASIKARVHVSSTYDMSEVFSVVYYALLARSSEHVFKECVRCLDTPRNVFCLNRKTSKFKCQQILLHENAEDACLIGGFSGDVFEDFSECGGVE
eukprot:TRINITY_DN25268_c0_g1_i1.p1 TRINITY_DN25268_c0_g1~~TRINITY_DN25268_c0_g1_i1.p1  ORF type:complete len:1515 (-),score=170.76 TRINITY_DN25268_c0_g1_i1:344-4888(-)